MREEWFDAFMTMAGLTTCLGLLMIGRGWWMFTAVLLGLALTLALVGVIIKIGWHEFIALPQAVKMALQSRRRRHGVRK